MNNINGFGEYYFIYDTLESDKAEPVIRLSLIAFSVLCFGRLLQHFNNDSCRKFETADERFKLGVFFVVFNYICLSFMQIHAHFYINYIIYYGLLIFCCQNVATHLL